MHLKPSFETLVDAHSKEIFTYLWRMLADPQDAEDSLQETYLRAFRAYPDLRAATPGETGANPRAWLYKIATNVALTHLKGRARASTRNLDLDPRLPDPGPPVDERVALRMRIGEVRQAVAALPEKQRAALILRKYQGLAYGEIASALEINAGAARANVYQALKKLRLQFAPSRPSQEDS